MSKETITEMFNQIAPRYDCVNRILSGGFDRYWRWKLAASLPSSPKLHILDCATGTGDQLLSCFKHAPHLHQAIGIDLAENMLKIGKTKLKRYQHATTLLQASATEIPFLDSTFDCVTISFGIRNIGEPLLALQEMHRVIRPGGRLLVLEFSTPTLPLLRKGYLFYLNKFLPSIGKFFSSHPDAYSYLAKTIQTFPQGEAFSQLMQESGFRDIKIRPLTLGIVTLYSADKKT